MAVDYATEKFILRVPVEADSAAIRQVAEITWEATYTQSVLKSNRMRVLASSYSDAALRRTLRRAGRGSWFWVAEHTTSKRIIGFAEASLREGVYPDAELTRIYVLPEWQRQGVGRALLAAILTDLHSLGPKLKPPRLYLSVANHNQAAIAFYESRGFRYSRNFLANLPGQMLDMREYVMELE